jgi:3-oxoadipate enol-lactonase
VITEILDDLGVDRVHLIGNSWGGMIGGTFAALHPDRIGIAVLMNATASPSGLRQKPEVVATVNESVRRVNMASGRQAVTSVVPRRPDQRSLFRRIRTPVLVVAGAEDTTFPVTEAEEMADAIPGARFVVLEQSAHLAALESPAEVNALIDDFLADNPAQSS